MRASAAVCLHYGKSYLDAAITSVIDVVDEVVVVYARYPSHGNTSLMVNPESERELYDIASQAAGDKLMWASYLNFEHEGHHRETLLGHCKNDLILVLDSDEVWHKDQAERALEEARVSGKRNHLVNGIHFWRSLGKACTDQHLPNRIINRQGTGDTVLGDYRFLHLGYAQPPGIIEYKMSCHGHKAEIREGWFENTFLANAQVDVHPVCIDTWNAEDFDKETLPDVLKKHPYYELDVIE